MYTSGLPSFKGCVMIETMASLSGYGLDLSKLW